MGWKENEFLRTCDSSEWQDLGIVCLLPGRLKRGKLHGTDFGETGSKPLQVGSYRSVSP